MSGATRRFLLITVVVALVGGWATNAWTQGGGARAEDGVTAVLTPLDRKILEFANESQLEEVLNGIDPNDVYLSNGETLGALAARTQEASSRSLVFAPVPPCRLLDTRRAPEGSIRSGETRSFHIRQGDDGYSSQGGAAEGCGLPGLAGMTLKVNAVRAVALNVMTVDVAGPGSLAIWPANRSEPEIGSVSFAAALAGGGVTGGVIVPVCDEAGLQPCAGGDLKIRAKISGAHVVADVVGYFHAASPGRTQIDGLATRQEPADAVADESGRRGESTRSAALPSPPAQSWARAQTWPAPSEFRSDGSSPTAKDPDGLPPPYPLEDPNPLGGHAKIRAVMGTGEAGMPAGVNRTAIDAHLENDTFTFNRSAIRGTASTGNAIYGWAPTGRAMYGQTEDGYAVYGFDGGSAPNRGYGGYFYSTNGIGVFGYSGGDRSHPNILAPGVYGQSNRGVGVYGRGDTSDSYTFYNEGGYFEGGKGLFARGTDTSAEQGYGARIFSNNYRGMYVQGGTNWFDAYFGGDTGISSNGIVDRSAGALTLAVNAGGTAIEPGDLVALAGVRPSPEHGQPMLAVARVDAANRQAVIGVAREAHAMKVVETLDAAEYIDFSPTGGPAPPLGYLTVVTRGLAPAVKLSGLAAAAGWRVGDELALSAGGALMLADGQPDSVSIGKVVSPLDPQTATIGIYVDVD